MQKCADATLVFGDVMYTVGMQTCSPLRIRCKRIFAFRWVTELKKTRPRDNNSKLQRTTTNRACLTFMLLCGVFFYPKRT